jgi:nucleoside-diphosphate-sugar epimerase
MRVVITGGSGHIGSFLTPRLVEAGYTVISVSRTQRQPYVFHGAWQKVEQVTADRNDADFAQRVRDLEPDIVIDLISYTPESTRLLVEALKGRVQQFLHCGTIWVHGPSVEVPVTEEQPRKPFGDYGIRKAEIEAYLIDQARRQGFPAVVLHPGHLVGPGWAPLNPAGHFNVAVFSDLAHGREITLPNLGRETLHHVHADDVAQAFMKAIASHSTSVCESFHVVSPAALSMAGYAEAVATWFGQEARIRFLPWQEWRATVSEAEANKTWDHIARSPNYSIEKARRLINYQPRYRSLEALRESVMWLAANGRIDVPGFENQSASR